MSNQFEIEELIRDMSFAVEKIPQEIIEVSSKTSNTKPTKFKVKVRKRITSSRKKTAFVAIPKFGKFGNAEKIRLVNSNQTIVSFDIVMDGSEEEKEYSGKKKHSFLGLFKPSSSMVATGAKDEKNDETRTEQKRTLRYGTNGRRNSYRGIFGKCKPGGCLDPPFNEDSYSYSKKEENSKITDRKNKETIEDKLSPTVTSDISKIGPVDLNSNTSSFDRNYNTSPLGSKKASVEDVYSNNVITYPTPLTPSENLIFNKANKYIKRPDKQKLAHRESGENYFPLRNGKRQNSDDSKQFTQDSVIFNKRLSKNEALDKPSSRDSKESTIVKNQNHDVDKSLHEILPKNTTSAESIISLQSIVGVLPDKSESELIFRVPNKISNDAYIKLGDYDMPQEFTEITDITHNAVAVSENIDDEANYSKDNSLNSSMSAISHNEDHKNVSTDSKVKTNNEENEELNSTLKPSDFPSNKSESVENFQNNYSEGLHRNPDTINDNSDVILNKNKYESLLESDKVFNKSQLENEDSAITSDKESKIILRSRRSTDLDETENENAYENLSKESSSENIVVTDINNSNSDEGNVVISGKPGVDDYDRNVTTNISDIIKTKSKQDNSYKQSLRKNIHNDDNDHTQPHPDLKITLSVDKIDESRDKNLLITNLHNENDNISNKIVSVDVGFQSYRDSQKQLFLKSVDTKKGFVRYKDDIITTINSKVQVNTKMQIPMDPDTDLLFYIASKAKLANIAKEGSSVTLSNAEKQLETDFSTNFPHETSFLTSAKLNKTLSLVYEEQLLPLQNIIMSLKQEIDVMARQQALFKQTIASFKRKPSRVSHIKKCCCSKRYPMLAVDKTK